jgi:lipoprotein-anchoring transpeptidase ErfK/SrfK
MGKPPLSESELNKNAREQFDINPDDPTKTLVAVWQRNDFGQWAFALLKDGKKTGFFIHTTPDDELTPNGTPIQLGASHGCIHMRPVDRNEAKEKKYLDRGVTLHVTAFNAKGRPV